MVYVVECLSVTFWNLHMHLITSRPEHLLFLFNGYFRQFFSWTFSFLIYGLRQICSTFTRVVQVHWCTNCLRVAHESRVLHVVVWVWFKVLIYTHVEAMILASGSDRLLRWRTLHHSWIIIWILAIVSAYQAHTTACSLVTGNQLRVDVGTADLILLLRAHDHWWLIHTDLIRGVEILGIATCLGECAWSMRTANACGCTWTSHEWVLKPMDFRRCVHVLAFLGIVSIDLFLKDINIEMS
jgi:hypothetical protein